MTWGKVAAAAAATGTAVAVRRYARQHPGAWNGITYRLGGRTPDPDVDEHTLADRIRSTLGPLEKQLDVPRVTVLVEGRVALLHGEVDWPHEAAAAPDAVLDAHRRAVDVITLIMGVLRRAAPEEAHPAVLPGELRRLWDDALVA